MNPVHPTGSEQDQRDELAALLPAATATDLSRDRHLLLKEHLMTTMTEQDLKKDQKKDLKPKTAPGDRRRSPVRRAALPLGLAAAAVAAVLASGTSGSAHRPAVADASTGGTSLSDARDTGYTLQSDADGVVRLTVMTEFQRVDYVRLQHDLDRFGIPAHVYAGEPNCHAPAPVTPTSPAGGTANTDTAAGRLASDGWDIEPASHATVLLFQTRHHLAAGEQLFIYLPYAKTDPSNGFRQLEAGIMQAPAPSCMPSKAYTTPPALAAQMTP